MNWLNYHHLLYFWMAAREGSITKACRQLHLTQPTVSGQIRALAMASEERVAALPEVPTTAEAGLPGFTIDAWFAIFAPAGVPPAILQRLNDAMREATTLPDLRRRAEEGGVLLRPLTIAEMDMVARREIETLGRTIRENGITLE